MRTVLFVLMTLVSMAIQGQTYDALWQQARAAEANDLLRTQYDVLMKIVQKAEKEGQFGQLMAAELAGSRTMATISPESSAGSRRKTRHWQRSMPSC